MNVLLVEDDQVLNQNITEALKSENFNTVSIYDGLLAERMLRNENFDCVVMDISLPGKNGYEITREFRKFNKSTPVIILTAFGELEDKIQGYNSGADDYLTKPFYMKELLLRINALIKRSPRNSENQNTIVCSDIVIDLSQKKASRQGVELNLTPREFQILVKLTSNPGEIIPKGDFIKEIWGSAVDANTNTVEVYINFLRNKVDKPFGKSSIRTKVGYGYYFSDLDGN